MKTVPSPYETALAANPGRQHQTSVNGVLTQYWTYGPTEAEPALVMVHGFRGDHHGLEPVVAHLPELRVVVPDLPGFGLSAPFRTGLHSVEAYADWLVGFVRRLPHPGPVVVLGHSFGSVVVAAALARGLPASKAVLLNPIAAPTLSGPRGVLSRLAVLYYRLAATLPERPGTALLRSRLVVRAVSQLLSKSGERPIRRWVLAEHLRYFSVFADRRMVLEAFEASVSDDVSRHAAAIEVPVLLVGGDRDDITPVVAHERLRALLPHAELVMVAGVGHLLHYEAPGRTAEAVRAFLGSGER